MFPESFVERWVDELTKRGDVVLDPFSGRGTTGFQSLLMGRRAIAGDVNPVAYCVTHAKLDPPLASSVRRRLAGLERDYETAVPRSAVGVTDSEFFRLAYSKSTLTQLLFLRTSLNWRTSRVDRMIAALVLGSLHGDASSPYYLSNQMPRTISTKPAYSVKYWSARALLPPQRDVFAILRERLAFRYETSPPRGEATVFLGDMRSLPHRLRLFDSPVRCVITSPPYLDVTNFEEDQWLRLWFLGGPAEPTRNRLSRDDRHRRPDNYWSLIADLWRVLGQVLASRAAVVIRLGFRDQDPEQVARTLSATAGFSRRKASLVLTEVSEIRRRQTRSFRPGAQGCRYEIDCLFAVN